MPSRRELLIGVASMAGVLGLSRVARAQSQGKNLIVVMADGGWDPTFVFDPKPGLSTVDGPYPDVRLPGSDPLDAEEIGTWGEIDVTLNAVRRPQVTEFFEEFGHEVTVLRGLWVGSVSHPVCRRRMLTGSDGHGKPDITTMVGAELGVDRAIGVVDMAGTGWFGDLSHLALQKGREGQLAGLIDPTYRAPFADGTPRPLWQPGSSEQALVEQWIADRATDDTTARPWRQEALASRSEARRRAQDLRALGPELAPLLGEAYNLNGQAPLAVELLASGACASMVLDSAQNWDTHFAQDTQHASFDRTFDGLGRLVTQLKAAGLWEDTVVVVISEMGRTPKRNIDGGTDHWPYSAGMIMGGGIAGGKVCGATDDGLVGKQVDLDTGRVADSGGALLSYSSFAAGVLEHVGADNEAWLPGVQPFRGFKA